MKLAIVATVRGAGASLDAFLRYHRSIGFETFLLFFDDPADPDLGRVRGRPGVVALACDERLRARQQELNLFGQVGRFLRPVGSGPCTPEELIAQQVLNVEYALGLAAELGCDWLLHIDVDEALYPHGMDAPASFAGYQQEGAEAMVFFNQEALPLGSECAEYFAEMTVFKRHGMFLPPETRRATLAAWPRPGFFFLAYDNGKSAVRVRDDVVPSGSHRFASRGTPLRTMVASETAVLHYPYSSFDRYWRKHALMGAFPTNTILGQSWRPPTILEATQGFVARGDREGARKFFMETVAMTDPVERARLEAAGLLCTITAVAGRVFSPADACVASDTPSDGGRPGPPPSPTGSRRIPPGRC